jgi:hypothetical protein
VSDTGAVERPDPAGSADPAVVRPGSVARQTNAVTAEEAIPTTIIIVLEEPTEGTIGTS